MVFAAVVGTRCSIGRATGKCQAEARECCLERSSGRNETRDGWFKRACVCSCVCVCLPLSLCLCLRLCVCVSLSLSVMCCIGHGIRSPPTSLSLHLCLLLSVVTQDSNASEYERAVYERDALNNRVKGERAHHSRE